MNAVTYRGSGEAVPVGKILCLGRNYIEHAREMNSPKPARPIVFLKPSTALLQDGGRVCAPTFSRELHHEVEMVVVIGKDGRNISASRAMDFVGGYAVGLDMTLRDVQSEAKEHGLPWSVAKGFDTSAPVSYAMEQDKVTDPHNLTLSLKVNGKVRQHSNTKHMIFRIEDVISYVSSIFTLEVGDLIFTGTPEGVGPVVSGDQLEAELECVGTLRIGIA
ncbi:MAG: fumarylacetoacetate hydrolase family protein [Ignavibacteriae bacterium]|nr:fumarylacetoacetate hydrolase family protein [Ignavibacteriota bacterium]